MPPPRSLRARWSALSRAADQAMAPLAPRVALATLLVAMLTVNGLALAAVTPERAVTDDPAQEPLRPPDPATVLVDDFSDTASGWPEELDLGEDVEAAYVPGGYQLTVRGGARSITVPAPVEVVPGDADVLIMTDVALVEGDGRYGVYCQQSARGTQYSGVVGPDGDWGVFRHDGRDVAPLAGGGPGAVEGGARDVRVALSCTGAAEGRPATVTFAIDGRQVATISEPLGMGTPASSTVGLMASLDDEGDVATLFGDARIWVAEEPIVAPSGTRSPEGPTTASPSPSPSGSPTPSPSGSPSPEAPLPFFDRPDDEPTVTPTLDPDFQTGPRRPGATERAAFSG